MFLGKKAQSGASLYLGSEHDGYYAYRTNMTAKTTNDYDYKLGLPRAIHSDLDNNKYYIHYCEGANSGTWAICVGKVAAGNDFDNYEWYQCISVNGYQPVPYCSAVSNDGYIAIVGEVTDNDWAFVTILDTDGNCLVHDFWSNANAYRDIFATSCYWYGSSAGFPSLNVILENQYITTGSGNPSASSRCPVLVSYGNGVDKSFQDDADDTDHGSNSNYGTRFLGHKRQGYVPYIFAERPEPFDGTDADGRFYMINKPEDQRTAFMLSYHEKDGSTVSGYANKNKYVSCNELSQQALAGFKVKNGSYFGRIAIHDAKASEDSIYVTAGASLRSSSGSTQSGSIFTFKFDKDLDLVWCKSLNMGANNNSYISGYKYTGLIWNLHDRQFCLTQPHNGSYRSGVDGITIPYFEDINTPAFMQINGDGVAVRQLDIGVSTSVDPIFYTMGAYTDTKGEMYLSYELNTVYERWGFIKVPNLAYAADKSTAVSQDIVSSSSLYTGTVGRITVSEGTVPATYDNTSELDKVTTGDKTGVWGAVDRGTDIWSDATTFQFVNDVPSSSGYVKKRYNWKTYNSGTSLIEFAGDGATNDRRSKSDGEFF